MFFCLFYVLVRTASSKSSASIASKPFCIVYIFLILFIASKDSRDRNWTWKNKALYKITACSNHSLLWTVLTSLVGWMVSELECAACRLQWSITKPRTHFERTIMWILVFSCSYTSWKQNLSRINSFVVWILI